MDFRLASNTSEKIRNTGSAIYRESTTARHAWLQQTTGTSSWLTMNTATRKFDSIWGRTTKWTSFIINWTISWTVTTWISKGEKWACLTWVRHHRQLWHLPHPQFRQRQLRLCPDKVRHRLTPTQRICRFARRGRPPTHRRLLPPTRLHPSVRPILNNFN